MTDGLSRRSQQSRTVKVQTGCAFCPVQSMRCLSQLWGILMDQQSMRIEAIVICSAWRGRRIVLLPNNSEPATQVAVQAPCGAKALLEQSGYIAQMLS